MDKGIEFVVRVNCMTYNQASYIEDTMNGFCMQQTSFPFLCIIVDDASTDGEPDVIKKYLDDNFDRQEIGLSTPEETDEYIRIYARHKENKNCYFCVLLLKYNHYSTGMPKMTNIAELIRPIEYIALCEGDDYWTDTLKLQKQVDFFEEHEDVGYVFTKHQILRAGMDDIYSDCERLAETPAIIDLHYLLKNKILPQTLTICYKRTFYPVPRPKGLYSDLALLVMVTQNCKIGFINEYTGVYRMGVGICSRMKRIDAAKKYAKLHKALDIYTNKKFNYRFGRAERCRIMYQAYRVERKYYPKAYCYYVAWQISEKGFNCKNLFSILKDTFNKFRKIRNICH